MDEENLNNQNAVETPASIEQAPVQSTEPVLSQEPVVNSPAPEQAPVVSAPEPSTQESVAPIQPVSPSSDGPAFVKNLLLKAKEKIQFRKRQKLEKILKLASEKGKVRNDEVQKLLHVSDATAARYLAQLAKEGKLRRLGPPNNASYEPVS